MIGRRGFLGALIGAAVLDPERLLWVPGKKMISIPAPAIKTPRFQYILEFSRWGTVEYNGSITRTDWIQTVYGESGWDAEVSQLGTMEISPGVFIDRVLVSLNQEPNIRLYNGANCLSVGPPGNWRLGEGPDYKLQYEDPNPTYNYSLSSTYPPLLGASYRRSQSG